MNGLKKVELRDCLDYGVKGIKEMTLRIMVCETGWIVTSLKTKTKNMNIEGSLKLWLQLQIQKFYKQAHFYFPNFKLS